MAKYNPQVTDNISADKKLSVTAGGAAVYSAIRLIAVGS
jgi:hypothetical protein